MNPRQIPTVRDREHADPHELNRPVPKVLFALIAVLLGWAVYYIATHASGRESSTAAMADKPIAWRTTAS
jgi:hypothetical protein